MTTDFIIHTNEHILLTTGEYSDYCVEDLLISQREFNITEQHTTYRNLCDNLAHNHESITWSFTDWLVNNGLIKVLPWHEINLYNRVIDHTPPFIPDEITL